MSGLKMSGLKKMMLRASQALVLLFAVGIVGAACDSDSGGDATCEEGTSTTELEAVLVETAPTLDGVGSDDAWACVPTLEVDVSANAVYTPAGAPTGAAYPGLTTSKVQLKAVYTATDLYMVATWSDPTKSIARFPWEKAADGSWSQLENKDSTGHENTYYEDKLGVQWDINTPNFGTQGCYSSCHLVADSSAAAWPGKKYNNNPGEMTDMWHWKSVRTEPNGQLDDKHVIYVDASATDKPNGRTSDSKTDGGYTDNNFGKWGADCAGDPDGSLGLPCFMGPAGAELATDDTMWIFKDAKQTFVDSFVAGDMVAGMTTAPFVGSRGDVLTKARYADGQWTLEIRRSLTTAAGAAEDVQFTDLDAVYPFGVAVFDNTQINHAVHGGTLNLSFRR